MPAGQTCSVPSVVVLFLVVRVQSALLRRKRKLSGMGVLYFMILLPFLSKESSSRHEAHGQGIKLHTAGFLFF
eukprot:15465688-Alexandrium_andersonii.AAC.1